MEYCVLGYAGLLDGVESELDWLRVAVFIGVAIAAMKKSNISFLNNVMEIQPQPMKQQYQYYMRTNCIK